MRRYSWLLGIFVLAACEKEPSSIRVKAPRDAVQSTKAVPVLPLFKKQGDTIRLRASAFGDDGAYMGMAKVKWSSADPSVATVALDGLVTIVASGKAMIQATTTGYKKTLRAELAVEALIIDKVEIVPPELENKSIHMGETVQFQAKVYNDRGAVIPDAKVKWRTSGWAATVTPTGEVEGRAIGDTQVIAEVRSKRDRFKIIVLDWKKEKRRRRRR